MANSNTAFGLRPVGTIGSAGYVGRVQVFQALAADTQAIGLGDPVVLTGTGSTEGIPDVTRLTTAGTTAIVGVMVGVVPNPSDLTLGYRKASTLMQVLVDTDPNTIYEVQDSSTSKTTAAAATDIGTNVTLAMGTVNTTTGVGATILDMTTAATTATLNVKLLRLSPKIDNAIGSYAKWLVTLNNRSQIAGVAGV